MRRLLLLASDVHWGRHSIYCMYLSVNVETARIDHLIGSTVLL